MSADIIDRHIANIINKDMLITSFLKMLKLQLLDQFLKKGIESK